MLMDLEQIEDMEREAEALVVAERTAMAWHNPKLLERERHRLQLKLTVAGQVESAFAAAQRITEKLQRGTIKHGHQSRRALG